MPIIEVDHVTKEFALGEGGGIRRGIANTWRRIKREELERPTSFKALDDVTFSVMPGEVLGIIGHNGAGKSTLLKLLSNIARPTKGTISVKGRVAPLIEVGAGLVGDLTGRENVYLNGAILGMSRAEIDKKFDEIIEFAEIEPFIDTPVKRYSSGMQMRLGFSIATAVEAEILIVDEVLAVGDVGFQKKCIDRMEDLIRNQNRTVLIVGHNIRQIERICDRMLILEHGHVKAIGSPGEVSKLFLSDAVESRIPTERAAHKFEPEVSSGEIEIKQIRKKDTKNKESALHVEANLFEPITLQLLVNSTREFQNAEINIGLHNPEKIFVCKSSSSLSESNFTIPNGESWIEISIPSLNLCTGVYGLGLGIYDWSRRILWAGSSLLWIKLDAPPDMVPKLPPGTLSYFLCNWNAVESNEEKQTTEI